MVSMPEFRDALQESGRKITAQRLAIAEVFFASDTHLTLTDILDRVKAVRGGVGYATVYRTMRLLVEEGFAHEHKFGEGETLYEVAHEDHHDHLVCNSCGLIEEFESEEIEQIQDAIAASRGFKVLAHKHVLHGLCRNCQASGAN